jgi:hypothetical protein
MGMFSIRKKTNTKFFTILKKVTILVVILIIIFQVYQIVINDNKKYNTEKSKETIENYDEEETNLIKNFETIRIALYPPGSESDKLFNLIFSYTWHANNTEYTYEVTTLSLNQLKGRGNNALNVDNYDVLVVGASFSSCVWDSNSNLLLENIRKFISEGGGYIGVCAGATFASQGFEGQKIYEKYLNKNTLKIIDLYLNCDIDEESAYISKLGEYVNDPKQGMIPLNCRINRDADNPIFDAYKESTINITYGGGPGLYIAKGDEPLLGEVKPILFVNEDLMKTAPIHRWRKTLTGWNKEDLVKIDIFGQYAGVTSTYGKGRVMVLTAHPEIPLTIDGSVKEYIGFSSGYGIGFRIPRMVYMYEGEVQNFSKNWWIHRRAAAWLAGVPEENLPPCDELLCLMDKPISDWQGKKYNLYVNNVDKTTKISSKIISLTGKTIIMGEIDIVAYTEKCEYVEFYLDDELQYTDIDYPFCYSLKSDLKGTHKIGIKGYDKYGNYALDDGEYLFLKS